MIPSAISASGGSYRNATIATASGFSLQDLIGIETVSSSAHQGLVGSAGHHDQQAGKLGAGSGAHFSNTSSLVTSLSSSREGSPDKANANAMLFARPGNLASKLMINQASGAVSSWFPSTAISMGHLPVFAAWNDA